ncbi:MAG: hypothetical protein M1393_02025 [Candidatus Thermoplasmatota archaeon]|nr:hypothetical protein [Candidatus Thermoplasmatota archaeon]MCL6089803.1 hypothetical protein [Candidatus Thermoplasmatota archaeon]MDA8143364.1 hypothetical protein [Thermoplasmatales archaeon]
MNKKLASISATLFFIVFAIEIIRIPGTFTPVSQNLNSIAIELFGNYVVPFEVLSLILVTGIIGMFYIAGRED